MMQKFFDSTWYTTWRTNRYFKVKEVQAGSIQSLYEIFDRLPLFLERRSLWRRYFPSQRLHHPSGLCTPPRACGSLPHRHDSALLHWKSNKRPPHHSAIKSQLTKLEILPNQKHETLFRLGWPRQSPWRYAEVPLLSCDIQCSFSWVLQTWMVSSKSIDF